MSKSIKLDNEVYWSSDTIKLEDKRIGCSGAKWIRIASISCNSTRGKSFILNISTNYNWDNNVDIMLAVSVTYRNGKVKELVSKKNDGTIIDKIRLQLDETSNCVFLDIHYNSSKSNNIHIDPLTFIQKDVTLYEPYEVINNYTTIQTLTLQYT